MQAVQALFDNWYPSLHAKQIFELNRYAIEHSSIIDVEELCQTQLDDNVSLWVRITRKWNGAIILLNFDHVICEINFGEYKINVEFPLEGLTTSVKAV